MLKTASRSCSRTAAVAALLAALLVAPAAIAEVKLTASDGAVGDEFGSAVAVSGDVIVVGAWRDDDLGSESGAAYAYRYDGAGWSQEAKLTASDGAAGDHLGREAAAWGDLLVVAAAEADAPGSDSGAAYVFRYDGTTWNEEAKLTASDGAAGDLFGESVALFGDVIVVGATQHDALGSEAGVAYVFRYDGAGWPQEAKLTAADAAAGDLFGGASAVFGDVVVVGADGDDDNGSNSGSAYVFRYDGATWAQETKLVASDGATFDRFANSVSVFGDVVAVGAFLDDDNGANSGSAYLYRYEGASWSEEAKLTASDGATFDNFATRLALSGDTLLVASRFDDDLGSSSGSAYLYRYDGGLWDEVAKLNASDGEELDLFSFAVALADDVAVVGASTDDNASGLDAGGAYVFALGRATGALGASDGAAGDGFGASLAFSGDLAVVGAPLHDAPAGDAGSGYVFRYDGASWSEEAEFTASDGAAGDALGSAVAVSGAVVLAGAPLEDDLGSEAGAVYVFRHDGAAWNEEAKLSASGGGADDRFGDAVSLSGDVGLIGAPRDDDLGADAGAAYVFRYDGTAWNEEAKLTASDGAAGQGFGGSVVVSGDLAVVGAESDDDLGAASGSAYVFRYDGALWNEETKLTAADGAAGDRFGRRVGVFGDVAMVGASLDDDLGADSGAAYVFRYDGASWSQEAKLVPSDGAAGDRFGEAVSVLGDLVAIGAPFDDDLGGDAGAAYTFRYDGASWTEEAKLTAPAGAVGDALGSALAISGAAVLVGAPLADGPGSDAGAAHVFAECNDGVDNDGDGASDHPDDPGCRGPADASERNLALPCDDGRDNDGDGRADFDPVTAASPGDANTPPAGSGDPGCASPLGGKENPQCQDGLDNDPGAADGKDYDGGFAAGGPAGATPDPQCVVPWKDRERPRCGLGFELALLLPGLGGLRKRRPRWAPPRAEAWLGGLRGRRPLPPR